MVHNARWNVDAPQAVQPRVTNHAQERWAERIGRGCVTDGWFDGRDLPTEVGSILFNRGKLRRGSRYRVVPSQGAVIIWRPKGETQAVLITVLNLKPKHRTALRCLRMCA